MKTEVFKYTDYRKFLRDELEKRSNSGWGSITRLADAVQCQRSHFSRVLSGQKDLTTEQAMAIAHYWTFTNTESEYFLLLVDFARAGTPPLRAHYKERMNRFKEAQEDLANRLQQQSIGDQTKEAIYYSAWYWGAIHVLTSIAAFQTAEKIAEKLEIPLQLVQRCLTQLADFSLVRQEKNKWIYNSGSLHLPKTSPFISTHHQNWRSRAVFNSSDLRSDGLHYTIVQSISAADYERIKTILLETIDRYAQIANPSDSEELVSFVCDFYRV